MKYLLTLIIGLTSFVTFSQMSHQDSLNVIVDEYYRLNLKVFQSTSTKSDIDSLFRLFSDDFVYQHPKYGGNYSKKQLYDGYITNQTNGNYNGRVADIKILNRVSGLNAVSVSKIFIKREDKELIDGLVQMTLFEFKNGKIHRIREYW